MTHQDDDDAIDVIDALRSELKHVPLSPEFSARLRQRIDAEPDARGAAWLSGWRWLVPVAAVAAVVVTVVAISRTRPEAPQQTTARVPIEAPVVAPPQALGGGSNVEVRTSKSPRAAAASARAAAANPALRVITNQPAILRALWVRAGRGTPLVEVPIAVVPDTVPEIVVPPIDVSPIVVKPLGPQPAPGVSPIVR